LRLGLGLKDTGKSEFDQLVVWMIWQVWATGFYEELDFLNEAANQNRMRELLQENKVSE